MGFEKFIAGIILGAAIGNPQSQKMIVNAAVKGAGALTDMLNNKKDGVTNAPKSNDIPETDTK